ncbi:MAG: MotA/TolQ/ExbB proton channel family protein [Halobacteriovoraceae bacterium]|nr:MotA/TolQ/ExbB proton channel family protein [Halobacteriovoraceae bacterium]
MPLIHYINQGGPIMYLLLILNIIGLALIFAKVLTFNRENKNFAQTAKGLKGNMESTPTKGTNSDSTIELAKQEISYYISELEKGLNTLKVIAAVSPLLGLLGTVIGVLMAFQVMSQTGLSDPSNFAEGISMALITTVGGMIVAIPNFIGHSYLVGMLDRFEVKLEKELMSNILS